MVPRRNTMPMEMRTIGPDNERRWRGGGPWTELAISHLTRRSLDIAGYAAGRPWSAIHGWRWGRGRLSLQQLGYSDCQKQHGPGTVPGRTIQALDQRKNTYRD